MLMLVITLQDQQRSVVREMEESRFSSRLLCLPTNFGKTLTMLTALEEHPEELLPALVIAPKRVSERSWTEDFSKLGSVHTLQLFDAQKSTRACMSVDRGADIVVTSFHNFTRATSAITAGYFKTLIVDEVDLLSSSTSKRWKQARSLRKHFDRCYGMTGTAIPSDLTKVWAMMYIIDEGATFGKRRVKDFLHRFFVPGARLPTGVTISYDEKPGARESIISLMRGASIIRRTDDAQLVGYTVRRQSFPMTGEQTRLFQRAMRESVQEVARPGDSAEDVELKLLESTSSKASVMRQIGCGLQMVDGEVSSAQWLNTAKLDFVELALSDQPALIFFQYVAEREELLRRLGEGAELVTDTGAIDRWNRRETRFLIAHPASVSHGVNLQFGGSRVVWVSPPPTYSIFHQGCMRVARRGQKDDVTVFVLSFDSVLEPKRHAHWERQRLAIEAMSIER